MVATNSRLDEAARVAGGAFKLILTEGDRYELAAGVSP